MVISISDFLKKVTSSDELDNKSFLDALAKLEKEKENSVYAEQIDRVISFLKRNPQHASYFLDKDKSVKKAMEAMAKYAKAKLQIKTGIAFLSDEEGFNFIYGYYEIPGYHSESESESDLDLDSEMED